MLTKLYVNNYRCLVNFEIEFDNLVLLLGTNGSGKTSIFDILYSIRRLIIDNDRVSEIFSLDDMTVWLDSKTQTFELTVSGNEGIYVYKLLVEFNKEAKRLQIDSETLHYNGKRLFEFMQGKVEMQLDDKAALGYPSDVTRSALTIVSDDYENKRITWFKKWFEMLFILNLQPKAMKPSSDNESSWLNPDGRNFVSWYRYISQEHQDKIPKIFKYLQESIPGFDSFKLETAGKSRTLKVGFRSEDKSQKTEYFDFDRISDGQRVLIVLHLLLVGLKDMGHTLMLDEPENYVALAEIQPWLMELGDACGVSIPQIIIISHHPELIDYFGAEKCRLIDREPLGPTRVKPVPTQFEGSLKLSEVIARGWEHE
ncbi:MAG: AAA family ATPase [Candidatus Cloacimonetes bacterium]|jgi:predicted ATPase|nr:AAA family ATPase [Candidatus Cloacimonadota bacterium]MDY0172447.1 AAA family ATPase [Candidatus Cloacimonadaceae bacterium]